MENREDHRAWQDRQRGLRSIISNQGEFWPDGN